MEKKYWIGGNGRAMADVPFMMPREAPATDGERVALRLPLPAPAPPKPDRRENRR